MAPNLVLLHGFTNTGASWDKVVAALPERYRPLAPDIRGHGAASDARPVTLTAVIADVSVVATEPFELVGYSMGGRLALHAAL
ncbi:MAG: alpha/beta fold hydrolase, partial [Candidatus Limnocylindrales bacterium]